jgi:geranylgeranyl pyrophosphate synthase
MIAGEKQPYAAPRTGMPLRQPVQTGLEAVMERIYAPVADALDHVVLNIASVPVGSDRHPPEIEERLAHVLSAPGKRVRPATTLLASTLWGRPVDERSVNMATAVELLHIATLVHDDTVDRADTRRGRATASSLWGGTVAVLLGDYVFATSAIFVCETNSVRLIKRFAETIRELARGELHELLDAWQPTVSREDYFRRIYDKTASLFSTAAESGAVLGEADEEDIARLKEYGYNVGMAFQVHDDVLDFESTSSELGKPAQHDLAEGVLTLPAIIALEGGPARQVLLDYFAAPQDARVSMLPKAVAAIRKSGAVDEARAVANDFSAKAGAALSPLEESAEREALLTLAASLVWRRS